MSRVFVDTSAFIALAVATDEQHVNAARIFDDLSVEQASLVTTSYVLVETYALLGRRHGVGAVRGFRDAMMPLLEVIWVDGPLHDAGLELLLGRDLRRLSLVDAVAFLVIRQQRIDRILAFDRHFADEGFRLLR